jgi:D-alanine transaminase
MSRFAYVNGLYLRHGEAVVHIEDRGYQFADGIYEVCEIRNGRLIDEPLHMARLERSLKELRIRAPMSLQSLGVVMREVVRRNRVREGLVYVQITRGVAPRVHHFPADGTLPSVVVTAKSMPSSAGDAKAEKGVSVISVPDNRWERVDIKTVSLLPNVLAKQAAKDAGAYEAWFVDADGMVTEGSSTNAWIVTADGVLVTRPAERGILRGITRTVLFEVAKAAGYRIEERAFGLAEALAAREAFFTSATSVVMPVVELDGHTIANGVPGTIATELRRRYYEFATEASATIGG